MASPGFDNEEMSNFIEIDIDKSMDNAISPETQVKEEPEDTGYEQIPSSLTGHNFIADSRNSSSQSCSPVHTNSSISNVNLLDINSNPSSQIPLNDTFAGSTIRSHLQGTVAGKKMATVQNIVENLLKKNETLLAMSDAGGLKPNSRRVRAARDGFVKRSQPAFPSVGQTTVFPVSRTLQAHVNTSEKCLGTMKHHLLRPKSPTRKYDGMLKDQTHFTYALMESNAADQEIEKIFNVQNHELVCAIGSKTLITDKSNKVVASLEFSFFWCNFCPFSTNSKSLLTQHVLEHRFCCKYCAYESFCRSDVVRHMYKMHTEFKDTVRNLSYLTLLSDYLRVQGQLSDQDPDKDTGSIDQDSVRVILSDLDGHKRKSAFENDGHKSLINKVRKIDSDHEATHAAGDASQDTTRQSCNSSNRVLTTKADYHIFDMEVDVIDSPSNIAMDESTKYAHSPAHSFSTAADENQTIQSGIVHVEPPIQNRISQTFNTSHVPDLSEVCNTNHSHTSLSKGYNGIGAKLFWSCGYCTFQSSSQAEIKNHSSRVHQGKRHRYVASIRNMPSDLFVSTNIQESLSEFSSATSLTKNTGQSPQTDHFSTDGSHLIQISNDRRSDNEACSKTDTKSHRENSGLLKVKINSSTPAKKEASIVKCYHCTYTSKRHWNMKNHIYHSHKGMGLVAVASESPCCQIFFCARDDCTFRTEDVNAYANHVDQCTPWNKPKLADVEVEPHIRECLNRTIALAEASRVKENEHAKLRLKTASLSTAAEHERDNIHSNELLLHEQSSGESETHPPCSPESELCHTDETSGKNTVNLFTATENDSENVIGHLCVQDPTLPERTVELDNLSGSKATCHEILTSENILDERSQLENQRINKDCICNSEVPGGSCVDVADPQLCTSAACVCEFISDSVVDVRTRPLKHLSDKNKDSNEVKNMLVLDGESDKVKPCSDDIAAESSHMAGNVSNKEVASISPEVLPVGDSEPMLQIDPKELCAPQSETEAHKYKIDHKVAQCLQYDCSRGEINNSKNVSQSEVSVQEMEDISSVNPNIACVDNKACEQGSPSLKVKLKMFGYTATYNFSKSTLQSDPEDSDRKIRLSDSSTRHSSSSSDYNNTESNMCTKTSPIQNQWIKDLIDSTEDSDSDKTLDSQDYCDALNSAPDVCKYDIEHLATNERNSSFDSSTFRDIQNLKNSKEHASLIDEDKRNLCLLPEDLIETEQSKTLEGVTKPCYSFVPLRTAAVKAISKMKPVLTNESGMNKAVSRSSFRAKKSALKCKLENSNQYLPTSHKTSACRKHKLISCQKSSSKQSKSVYMCHYCIDVNEGPLEKIKSHVLNNHSSMPPVVINCFKQRHHISCQFYICPYDSCYKLSRTQEELEGHKSTHEQRKLQTSSAKECERVNKSAKRNPCPVNKASKANVRNCRVKLDHLDMSKINSEGSVLITPEKKKYQCLYCTSYYYEETLQGMKAHYFQEHEGQLIVIRDTEASRSQLPSRIYVCVNSNCERSYTSRSDLDSHANSHKSNLIYIYECASCGWYSASHAAACQHVKNEHSDEKNVSLVHSQVSVNEYGQMSKTVL